RLDLALLQLDGGAPHHPARGLDVHVHLGERERDRLKVRDHLAERLALLRVVERELVGRAREAHLARGVEQPAAREHALTSQKKVTFFWRVTSPEQAVGVGDAATLEDYLGGVHGVEAEQRVALAGL